MPTNADTPLIPEELDALLVAANDCPEGVAVNIARCVGELRRLREAARWIPVSDERKPVPMVEFNGEISESVLLYDAAKNFWIGSYNFVDKRWWIEQGLEDDWEIPDDEPLYRITHWLALPAPPAESREKGRGE